MSPMMKTSQSKSVPYQKRWKTCTSLRVHSIRLSLNKETDSLAISDRKTVRRLEIKLQTQVELITRLDSMELVDHTRLTLM